MMFGQRYSPPVLASAILVVWMVAALQAQEAKDPGAAKAAMQAKVAELKQSLAANQKALQQYTWIETTEISMKGEVKKTERKECRYGTDGKVIKTDLGGGGSAATAAKLARRRAPGRAWRRRREREGRRKQSRGPARIYGGRRIPRQTIRAARPREDPGRRAERQGCHG